MGAAWGAVRPGLLPARKAAREALARQLPSAPPLPSPSTHVITAQWFTTGMEGGFALQGACDNVWRHLWLSKLGSATGSAWWRPGMLLDTPQCREQLPTTDSRERHTRLRLRAPG